MDWKADRFKPKPKTIDLITPDGCRKFIAKVRLGDKKEAITHVKLEDGSRAEIKDLPDDAVVRLARSIAESMRTKKIVKRPVSL